MTFGVIYGVLVISVFVIDTRGPHNAVRISKQTPVLSTNIPSESSPVVSAVLLECPKEARHRPNVEPSKDHPPRCEQQLMVNIRVNPSFHIEKVEKFLILDEVYDPRKRSKAKIMSPYLIEISRGEPIMMYPLEFTKSVKCNAPPPQKPSANSDTTENSNVSTTTANPNAKPNCGAPPAAPPPSAKCEAKTEPKPEPKTVGKTCEYSNPNEQKSEPSPEQESLKRVIDKIADAFASATKPGQENEGNPPPPSSSSKHNPLMNIRNNFHTLQEVPFANQGPGQSTHAVRMVYDDYDSEYDDHMAGATRGQRRRSEGNGKRRADGHRSVASRKASRTLEARPRLGHYSKDTRVARNKAKHRTRDCESQSMANVGIAGELVEKLENHSNLAQVGLVRASSAIQGPPVSGDALDDDDTLRSRKADAPVAHRRRAEMEPRNRMLSLRRAPGPGADRGYDTVDYALVPKHRGEFGQEQLATDADVEAEEEPGEEQLVEYRDEVPDSFVVRPASPRTMNKHGTKRHKGHLKAPRMPRTRVSVADLVPELNRFDEEEEDEYDEDLNNMMARENDEKLQILRESYQDPVSIAEAAAEEEEEPVDDAEDEDVSTNYRTATFGQHNPQVRDDAERLQLQMDFSPVDDGAEEPEEDEDAGYRQRMPLRDPRYQYNNYNYNYDNDRRRRVEPFTIMEMDRKFEKPPVEEKKPLGMPHMQKPNGAAPPGISRTPVGLDGDEASLTAIDWSQYDYEDELKQNRLLADSNNINSHSNSNFNNNLSNSRYFKSNNNINSNVKSPISNFTSNLKSSYISNKKNNNYNNNNNKLYMQLKRIHIGRTNLNGLRNDKLLPFRKPKPGAAASDLFKGLYGDAVNDIYEPARGTYPAVKASSGPQKNTFFDQKFEPDQANPLQSPESVSSKQKSLYDPDRNDNDNGMAEPGPMGVFETGNGASNKGTYSADGGYNADQNKGLAYNSAGQNKGLYSDNADNELSYNFNHVVYGSMNPDLNRDFSNPGLSGSYENFKGGSNFNSNIDINKVYDTPYSSYSDFDRNYPIKSSLHPKQLFEKTDMSLGFPSLWDASPSKPIVEQLDLINPSLFTESPEKINSNPSPTKFYYQPAVLQLPRSSALHLINREPPQFLPKQPPFSRIIDDPYLSINDKLRVIDIVDPRHGRKEDFRSQLSSEIEDSFIIEPSPIPVPYVPPVPSTTHVRRAPDSSKMKRSFVFYDDLAMRDTLLDNDYNFDDTEQRPQSLSLLQPESQSQPGVPRHVEEDVTPCESCGGKGKKPHGKTDTAVHTPESAACRCRNQRRSSCDCEAPKRARSVSDSWYSVFNMSAPLPFLTTKLRIFRKRHHTWWKIAPSITLNSLSGIFANANLSILFSSHVDIFQLEKSLRLQNHQLLIPKDDKPLVQSPSQNQTQSQRQRQEQMQSGQSNSKSKTQGTREASRATVDTRMPDLSSLNLNPSHILAIDSSELGQDSRMAKVRHIVAPNHGAGEGEADGEGDGEGGRSARLADGESNAPDAFPTELDVTAGLNEHADYGRSVGGVDKGAGAGSGPIHTIGDLGYFPATMNLLERCPNDKNRLCLNMLEDRVPAYSIKVKMPFRENALIHRNALKVKIARIITDATTRDVLQVSVDVINEGHVAQEFSICVCNCPMSCASAAKTTVDKILLPHVGETVTFLLPLLLESGQKHKKFNCDVIVKAVTSNEPPPETTTPKVLVRSSPPPARPAPPKKKIAAIRPLTVEPDSRCFCIWECGCHCVPKLETYVDFHVCHKLPLAAEKKAGLLLGCEPNEYGDESCDGSGDDDDNDDDGGAGEEDGSGTARGGFCAFLHYALILVCFMLFLGLIKAFLGLCVKKVGRCGYGYVQPGRCYEAASTCRRFSVNTVFFIIFPFLFWCKCFTPSEEDLLVASTEWQCSLVQNSRRSTDDDDDDDEPGYKGSRSTQFDDDEEEIILSQHIDRQEKRGSQVRCCGKSKARLGGGQDVIGLDTHLTDWSLAFHEGVFDEDDDADEEANTKYVLQALVESRESLKKLLRNHSSQKLNLVPGAEDPKAKEAEDLVRSLKAAQIVYRTFDRPVGNVRHVPPGRRYSVQGYFLPSLGAEYEFVNYNPMAQHRGFTENGTATEALRPPVMLCPNEFSRVYANKTAVLEAGDLSVGLPPDAPCINISTMAVVAASVARLASEPSGRGPSSRRSRTRAGPSNTSVDISKSTFPPKEAHADDEQDEEAMTITEVKAALEEEEEEPPTTSQAFHHFSISEEDQLDDESNDLLDDISLDVSTFRFDRGEE